MCGTGPAQSPYEKAAKLCVFPTGREVARGSLPRAEIQARSPRIAGEEPASSALFVGVGRAKLAISIALVVEAALTFGFALLLLLAVAAQACERHYFEAFFGNLESARLADAVGSLLDPLQRIIDLLDLYAFAVGENEVDLAVPFFGREIVGVHSLVFVAFAFGSKFQVDLAEQLVFHFLQMLAHLDEELLSASGGPFFRHGLPPFLFSSCDCFGHAGLEVVAERFVDSGADELSRFGLSLQKDRTVDLRRLPCRAAAHPRRAPGHRALDQNLHLAPDQVAILPQRYFRLRFHQLAPARALDPLRHLAGQVAGSGVLLARVSEDAHAIEFDFTDEAHKPAKSTVVFARKSDDERRPERHVRNMRPHAIE